MPVLGRAKAAPHESMFVRERDSRMRLSGAVSLSLSAPAKINLFLAITGKRDDGFHNLVSVVAPVALADTLRIAPAPAGEFRLTCSDGDLACDESNLVLKAARSFVAATAWRGGAAFHLEKRIPTGAGLGGGSSDAVAALKGLNTLAGNPLDLPRLEQCAAGLGSDCALFLRERPVVMRGRGERLEELPPAAVARICGRRVVVFKPAFGIATAWAYRRMAEMAALDPPSRADERVRRARTVPLPSSAYLQEHDAEGRLAAWVNDGLAPLESLLFNNLEGPAFEKHIALPTMLERLRERFGIEARMTGSGSACFALLADGLVAAPFFDCVREGWGESAFVAETRIG